MRRFKMFCIQIFNYVVFNKQNHHVSRQVMHYGGNFDPALACLQAKLSKYYSEDGSYEVILDRTTGKEKHLMYKGGSPYESDIVLLKDFVDATAKYVFLHKDYLGTILQAVRSVQYKKKTFLKLSDCCAKSGDFAQQSDRQETRATNTSP